MKTVFARASVVFAALAVVALPASAFASSKTTHSHSVAKKEPKKKATSKHHGSHKSAKTAAPAGGVATKAP